MCRIIEQFAEKLVAIMGRLMYFPTVTALKPNCPQVSWLSPTELSRCPFEKWIDITCTNFKRSFFWKQAKLLSSSLWCVYQTLWNIVLKWGPVASVSQDKWLFRFLVTHACYHAGASANILYLLPTYVRVLFNSCGWHRGCAFPGCNPLSGCRKGVLGALATTSCAPCKMGAVMLSFSYCLCLVLYPGTVHCSCSKWAHFPRKRKKWYKNTENSSFLELLTSTNSFPK